MDDPLSVPASAARTVRVAGLVALVVAGLAMAGCASTSATGRSASPAPRPHAAAAAHRPHHSPVVHPHSKAGVRPAAAHPHSSAGVRPSAARTRAAARSRLAAAAATRRGGLRLLVEPNAGMGPIYALITGARHSIDLTMYELDDPTAEADLAAAAARGVEVRVILDRHLEQARNEASFAYLRSHRVQVVWAPAGTTFHQKTLTVDDSTSVIMTLNFDAADYATTRDFAVIDTVPADVSAVVATFDADFAGQPALLSPGADLVWSPGSQPELLSVIDGARDSLAVENEEMDDPTVTAALESACRRGVDVNIVMTADSPWDQAFDGLHAAGCHVATLPYRWDELYIHAKVIVADAGRSDQRAFVGSENFSVASLFYNRELGVVTTNPALVAGLASTVAADAQIGTPWS